MHAAIEPVHKAASELIVLVFEEAEADKIDKQRKEVARAMCSDGYRQLANSYARLAPSAERRNPRINYSSTVLELAKNTNVVMQPEPNYRDTGYLVATSALKTFLEVLDSNVESIDEVFRGKNSN